MRNFVPDSHVCNLSMHVQSIMYSPVGSYSHAHQQLGWDVLCTLLAQFLRYRVAQNVGGGKHRRIWRLSIDSPKFSHPSIVSTLKCIGKPTQFAKVIPSNYTSRVISPKFHPANILRYTVLKLQEISKAIINEL